jgi:general secretion pathway protein K
MTPRPRQRGAALLLAMMILTLVATLASGMVWQQSRSIQVEAAERARVQSAWILNGALDWARLILREDARSGGADHLGEPWATPLAEARLSTFLAADRDNNAEGGPEAFLSGSIVDAQARYNLRNLIDGEGKPVAAELKAFARLCDAAGLPSDTATRVTEGLRTAWAPPNADDAGAGAVAPQRVDQLGWIGIDAATRARLEPYVVLLPARTPVNVNTAGREVLLAAIDGLDLATAERLLQVRQRQPFRNLDEVREQLPQNLKAEENRIDVKSRFFDIFGRLRLDDRALEEHSLVERRGDRGLNVVTITRERRNVQSPAS